jgi:hypothetical protein
MFWNRKSALTQRAEQAEAERDELRHYLSIREQQLVELQDLYNKQSENNQHLLETLNTLLTEYSGMIQPPHLHQN